MRSRITFCVAIGNLLVGFSGQGRVGAFNTGASRSSIFFLLPSWPNAGENFSGLLDVRIRPEPDAHASNFLQWGSVYRFSRYMALQGQERASQLLGCLSS